MCLSSPVGERGQWGSVDRDTGGRERRGSRGGE